MATVLVIDDDESVRRIVGRMLVTAGYEVFEARDGIAGMEALRRHSPDLVITDIVMPDQEGIETFARIREVSDVPVIAISGSVVSDDFDPLRDARMLGANVTLSKPSAEKVWSPLSRVCSPPATVGRLEP